MKIITLALVLVIAIAVPCRAENPTWSTMVYIDGIFGSESKIQETVSMLKGCEQKILDLKVLARNGYGKILRAEIVHQCAFPISQAVLDECRAQRVTIDGIWGGNPCTKILDMARTLQAAEQKIVRVEVTAVNGYGKILSANVYHISTYKYEALMGTGQ